MAQQRKAVQGAGRGDQPTAASADDQVRERNGEIAKDSEVEFDRRGNVADRRAAGGDRRIHLVDRRGVFSDRRRATEARYRAPLDAQLHAQVAGWQDAERRRIAADLHDSIGSSLCTIRLKLQDAIEKLPSDTDAWKSSTPLLEIVADISRAMEEVRRIAMDLRPAILDDLGIVATISWLARQLEASKPGIRVEKRVDLVELNLPESQKTAIFRVAQEALNNVVNHSGARVARIELVEVDQRVQLTVTDDGQGFAMSRVLDSLNLSEHFGVANMRQRASSSGGELVIRSEPGGGTVVTCTWPRPKR